jgi:hypothetical protein
MYLEAEYCTPGVLIFYDQQKNPGNSSSVLVVSVDTTKNIAICLTVLQSGTWISRVSFWNMSTRRALGDFSKMIPCLV